MEYGIKIEIHPTVEQEEYLLRCCREYHNMRNWLVAKFKNNLPNVCNSGIIGYKDKDMYDEYGIKEIPKRIYRSVLTNYGYSLRRFYTKLAKNPPKFHKYDPNKQSFCIVDRIYKIMNYKIQMPIYVGCTIPRDILLEKQIIDKYNITEIHDVHYTKYKNKWYVSGFMQIDTPEKMKKEYLGLDWGIKNFMTTSNGEYINYPKSVLREFQRIKRLQSIKDKKIKNSKNYNKVLKRLQSAYERMNNIKKDFIEKKTTELSKEYNICVEDLHLKNIIDNKHKNITRSFIIAPRFLFVKKLKWKCQKYGSIFTKVNPRHTSMTCCKCGTIKENLKITDRIFICNYCGNKIDRDINAAINIRIRGMLNSSNGE